MQRKELSGLFKEFATGLYGDELRERHNKIYFCFNGISYIGGSPIGIMLIDSWTNDININKTEHNFAQGHKMSKLWTITLKFSEDKWEKLLEYGNKYEMSFDVIVMNERDCIRDVPFREIFRHQITLNKSNIYDIDLSNSDMLGWSKIEFKKGGIKVIKTKNDSGNVVVKIALLENGFYERYHYTVIE
jgi:hypothetical protein